MPPKMIELRTHVYYRFDVYIDIYTILCNSSFARINGSNERSRDAKLRFCMCACNTIVRSLLVRQVVGAAEADDGNRPAEVDGNRPAERDDGEEDDNQP